MRIESQVAAADGLTAQESLQVRELVAVWRDRSASNERHDCYYDGKVPIHDLGIAIPPDLRWVANACGWPRLAVDYIANRSQFDGWTTSDEEASDALAAVERDNAMASQYSDACTSALKHGLAMVTVTAGRPGTLDPPVVIRFVPATAGSVVWSDSDRSVTCGLVVVATNGRRTPQPTVMALYTATDVVTVAKVDGAWTVTERVTHNVGRPLMECLVYKPTLERPLGTSRINDCVRDLTDDYIRATARAEIAAEFAATTQKYLLGVDPDQLPSGKWTAFIDSLLTISRDENNELPQFGQLTQPSMQPHSDYQRMLACRMSAETSIPVSALGVASDNPSSADAIAASREDAVIEVQRVNQSMGQAMVNVGRLAMAVAGGEPFASVRSRVPDLAARFANPSQPSVSSVSDALMKQASVIPWLAETDLALERLGYNGEEIQRLRADKRRYEAKRSKDAAIAAMMQGSAVTDEPGPDAV